MALWTMFAAFGLPHEHPDYHKWVQLWPEGSLWDPNFPRRLDWAELDAFLYWLWRGEKWATAFWATRIADGTMLSTTETLYSFLDRASDQIA